MVLPPTVVVLINVVPVPRETNVAIYPTPDHGRPRSVSCTHGDRGYDKVPRHRAPITWRQFTPLPCRLQRRGFHPTNPDRVQECPGVACPFGCRASAKRQAVWRSLPTFS